LHYLRPVSLILYSKATEDMRPICDISFMDQPPATRIVLHAWSCKFT